MLKKTIAFILSMVFILSLFAGCSDNSADITSSDRSQDKKLSIVCTIFPQYDWIREILGNETENVDLTLLMDSGTDLHSYQPTAGDIITISDCDLFVYVGGESDERWVGDTLSHSNNENRIIINMMDILASEIVEEETVEGMQGEQEEHEAESDEPEYDEHVWLSVNNAVTICNKLTGSLCELDPDNAAKYTANNEAYSARLNALTESFTAKLSNKVTNTIVVGDRFPFRYLTDDFGIAYFAAFSGCSAESEASFETVVFLAKKIDELGLNYIITTEKTSADIAGTIIENTTAKNQQILVLDSLQTVSADRVKLGTTYYQVMSDNFDTLAKALLN